MPFVLFVTGTLLGYNSLVSLSRIPELVTIPTNLLLGTGLLGAARRQGLSSDELGIREQGLGRALGLGIGLGAVAFIGAALASSMAGRSADRHGAEAVRSYRGWRLALKLLFQVPVATALVEEVAFRGVLFAAIKRRASQGWAVGVSTAVFALWHVPSTLGKLPRGTSPLSTTAIRSLPGPLVGTAVLGLALAGLRIRTRSIWAGVPFHAGFNAGGVVGAVRHR
jgi:CAAX protease family protein